MPEPSSLQILLESQRRIQDLYSRFLTPMLGAEIQKRSPYYQALTEAARQRAVTSKRQAELYEAERGAVRGMPQPEVWKTLFEQFKPEATEEDMYGKAPGLLDPRVLATPEGKQYFEHIIGKESINEQLKILQTNQQLAEELGNYEIVDYLSEKINKLIPQKVKTKAERPKREW